MRMKVKWRLMQFYFVSVAGLFLYLKGFFPVKISNAGFSTLDDIPPPPSDSNVLLQLSSEDFHGGKGGQWATPGPLPRNFTKLVLIVIDALREDFFYGAEYLHNTPFLHELMMERSAATFVSRVQAPTITMPRIKALTSGNLPGYVDVFLSLDQAKEYKEDNLIRSAFADGRSIVFYGDDTWIKLFPSKFKRKDGTSSFFVNDHTTVDNNVTKHLDDELSHPDNFDIMILHYSGLDHIGLTVGAKSLLIDEKLQEMDSVIQRTYKSLLKHDAAKSSKSLIVVTGDHGMTEKGSHGGTTMPERNVPLIFLSPGIDQDEAGNRIPPEVEQTDIAVTLSLLLGLQIPRNSLGKPIVQLIQRLTPVDQLHAMQYNCHHLLSLGAASGSLIDHGTYGLIDPLQLYRDALLTHATWLKHTNAAEREFSETKNGYLMCQQAMSERLMANIASYNYLQMGLGMFILWVGYLAVVITWGKVMFAHKVPVVEKGPSKSPSSPLTWGVLATVGTIIHGISILSSSYLEEEHQTWYFMTVTFLTILFVSVISDMAAAKLGMSERVRKGFFAKDKRSSPGISKAENEMHLRRGKSDESVDAGWDFVELELEENRYSSDKRAEKVITDKSNDLKTCIILVSCLLAHRMLRAWNRTGIQHADSPDIGDWLNDTQNKFVLSFALILGLVLLALLLEVLTSKKDPWRRFATWIGLALVYCYRAATGHVLGYSTDNFLDKGLLPAKLVYLIILVILGRVVFLKSQSGGKAKEVKTTDYLISDVVLLGALLLRPHNVWALVFNLFLYWSVFRQLWPIMSEEGRSGDFSNLQLGKIVLRTTLCYWFGQMSYFSTGNSNSLATIDVAAGYVGISSQASSMEDSVVVFLLVFATYVGPLIWMMLCLADSLSVTSEESSASRLESRQALLAVFSTIAFLRLTPVAFYVMLITAMRFHLFIWSVFAPKLLYEAASAVIFGTMLLAASVVAKWIY